MEHKLAVIGVGNMAKAIISGIINAHIPVNELILFDKNSAQYSSFHKAITKIYYAKSVKEAVEKSDIVLLAVKPQNYDEVLQEIISVAGANQKLYISIGAGITVESVSNALKGALVVRVLPNVPMLIGKGVSVICRNPSVPKVDFDFVCSVFQSAGSIMLIEESEMNRIIGVTSSSPAYVFRFIRAIWEGAVEQGIENTEELLTAICDMVIGSAMLLKNSGDTPEILISKVASKGGTTEQALKKLDELSFDCSIKEAMKACTARAEELGNKK